jgi:hypothetical protein
MCCFDTDLLLCIVSYVYVYVHVRASERESMFCGIMSQRMAMGDRPRLDYLAQQLLL